MSPRLFKNPPNREGLLAILAHELQHLSDYTQMSGVELTTLALKYWWYDYFRLEIHRYERQTDRSVLNQGWGLGLIKYREWLYDNLPKDVARERKVSYLTPREIKEYLATHANK